MEGHVFAPNDVDLPFWQMNPIVFREKNGRALVKGTHDLDQQWNMYFLYGGVQIR